MLWWLLLRDQKTRMPLGSVVDLCARCEQLRFFRVIRIVGGSALSSARRYLQDEKWCAGCGTRTPCNPQRYLRPLSDMELASMSEDQAFLATTPGLKARLDFIDEVQRDGQARLGPADQPLLTELLIWLKQFEALGRDTSELLHELQQGAPVKRALVTTLLERLHAEDRRSTAAAQQALAQQQARSKTRWQSLAFGAVAGIAAALLTLLAPPMAPWWVVGGAVTVSAAGALVMGALMESQGAERWTALLPAVLLASVGSALAWFSHTRSLRVDNPSADAITVFVDDRLEPIPAEDRVTLYVEKQDSYQLGWAPAGSPTPADSFDTPIADDALYNPGSTACYWLQIDVYSLARDQIASNREPWGPQPVRELYMFDKIDNWFADNPDTVDLPNSSSTVRRTALLYDVECMRFISCQLEVRRELQTCRQAAVRSEDTADSDACFQRAQDACPNAAPPQL